jgi:Ca-activated chloride channel family protein
MRLLHPLLLLSAIPVAVLAIALARRSGRTGPARRPLLVGLRYASLTLLVLALAQPQIGHGSGGPTTLVIDRSASIGPRAGKAEQAWLRSSAHEDCVASCRVVQFAGTAKLTSSGSRLLPISAGGQLDGGQTDLESALQLALANVPTGGQIVALSDGFQTAGQATEAAAEARARDVRIDVVPLSDDGRPDAGVTRLQAPAALHAGDPLSLEVTVRATVAATATLSLRQDGVAVGSQPVSLAVGDNPLLLSLTAPAAGSHSYEVSVAMPGDRVAQNNALATTVRVTSEPTVLVAGTGSSIADMLRANGVRVQSIAPTALPTSPGAYSSEDAVVLDDVSASQLGEARAGALTSAVHSGEVGLLVLGGPHSFSLGEYTKSTLQQALPVSSLVPGNLQQRHVGLELILDRSGSMIEEAGGVPKLEMAQIASKAASKLLAANGDELGIVDFDVEPHTLVPVTRVTPGTVLDEIDSRIDGLEAEGGTNIYKALADGAHQIEASNATDRHIVLITDGVSEAGSYTSLLPELAKDHITVSTVALGDEADFSLLKAIAKSTGGTYYATDNAGELPRIFAKETHVSARAVRLHGHIDVTAGASSPIVRSLSGQVLAPLRGNVVTTLKSGAEADLLGQDSGHSPDPVLAQWQYGIGRVVTWTPGLAPEWAGAWVGRPQVWQDTVRWLERGVGIPALTPSLVPGSATELELDTVQNANVSLDLAQLSGVLMASDGARIPLTFTQTAPSHYVTSVPPLDRGIYSYTVSDGTTTNTGLLAVPYPAEYRLGQPEDTPLGALAAATGGRVLGAGDPASLETDWVALWWWLALAALLCFLADVILRLTDVGRAPSSPGARRERPAEPSESARETALAQRAGELHD